MASITAKVKKNDLKHPGERPTPYLDWLKSLKSKVF